MLRRHHFAIVVFCTFIVALTLTSNAMAYIGPGGGMEFIGYALGLLAMLGAAFVSFVLWPFYKILNWWRGSKSHPIAEQSVATSTVADTSSTASPLARLDNVPATPASPSVPGKFPG